MEIRLRKFGHSLIDIAIELCSIFAQKKKLTTTTVFLTGMRLSNFQLKSTQNVL